MELTKLFEVQTGLKKHIGYKGEDKLPKMMLAMLVEFMECANDWQGFKYWKKNNAPKISTEEECWECDGRGVGLDEGDPAYWDCDECGGFGVVDSTKNPLLEEYVDGFHFVLETGLDLLEADFIRILPECSVAHCLKSEKDETHIIRQYKQLTHTVLYIDREVESGENYLESEYEQLIEQYLYLGRLLGFTEEQIEQAYMKKNEVNHQRQESGY